MAGRLSGPETPGFILYQSADRATRLTVRLAGRSVWLTQTQMAELFQTTKQNISFHIQNILQENELDAASVVKEYLTTAADAKQYGTLHYNLEMIIAVGYRVRSTRGTQFRQWATATLSEYLHKGFVLDDERLKDGRTLGDDYFDELLERIRDIRASERRFYQKITDIYATSIDYDARANVTQEFFATVQYKLHFAIHGQTAAEVIVKRADAGKPHMGLTTWKYAPDGPVRRGDIDIAKNYLSEGDMRELNRTVTMYLDYAEDQAHRKIPMHMADWVAKLDGFLTFNERDILGSAGKVSAALAPEHAQREFEKYEPRRLEASGTQASDFDRFVDDVKRLDRTAQQKPSKANAPRGSSKKKKKGGV